MQPLSLRARLTLWYLLALTMVLGLFAIQVLWGERRIGLKRVDRELESVSAAFIRLTQEEVAENLPLRRAGEQAAATLSQADCALVLLDASGVQLAAAWNDLVPLETVRQATPGIWSVMTPAGPWRVRIADASLNDAAVRAVVATSLADFEREQDELAEAMRIAVPFVLLLAGGGGFWLASVGLRPISQMARRASRVSVDRCEDLGFNARRDELGLLAGAFNELLARLRAALNTQRRFMADASHELRTPVSISRTACEVALGRDDRASLEYREALAIACDQMQRLGRLVDDMLVLARADAGKYPLRIADLYLDDVIADCCCGLEVLSRSRQVSIRLETPRDVAFRGDEELLRRLVDNIVQNAVQHTAAGGTVAVTLAGPTDGRITIRVADEGPGIPPTERDRIFERFVRLDPARHREGAGLGLPIARWIAEAHGGTLMLERSSGGGSTFCIAFEPSR